MHSVIQNGQSKKEKEILLIDEQLDTLALEAKQLFELLDKYSHRIRTLETELQKINANFPFSLKIKEENESHLKPIPDKHIQRYARTADGFFTKDFWYLSWEKDDNSKNFRLLLIIKEIEFVVRGDRRIKLDSQIKFQKPLVETNLQTRLQYSEYLLPFIDSFKEYLKNSRLTIEQGGIPF